MNWFAQHRQDWILDALRVYGFINREHLQRKFGISTPQASGDLRTFQTLNPNAMRYDSSLKTYVAAPPDVSREPQP
jgi:hypothetical protein